MMASDVNKPNSNGSLTEILKGIHSISNRGHSSYINQTIPAPTAEDQYHTNNKNKKQTHPGNIQGLVLKQITPQTREPHKHPSC